MAGDVVSFFVPFFVVEKIALESFFFFLIMGYTRFCFCINGGIFTPV